jgi:type II secretory pathway component PulF
MAIYEYTARDSDGVESVDEIEASSADEAQLLLRNRGLHVLRLSAQATPDAEDKRRPLSSGDAAELSRRVAQVSAARLPLATGLRLMADESSSLPVASALRRIAAQLEQGQPLESVLAESEDVIPRPISGLLSAAVRSGRLGDALSELVEHQQSARALRRSISGGLAYPLLVFCLAASVLLFLLVLVTGFYRGVFEDFELQLPLATRLLFWWRDFGFLVIVGGLGLALLIVVWVRWRRGRVGYVRLMATLPFFGPLWSWSGFAEWCGLLSVLVKNRIPLPEALRLAGEGVANAEVGQLSLWLAEGVERGETLSRLVSTNRRFPASAAPLLRWGEEKGMLVEALATVRDMLEARVRVRSQLLQSILPPMLFLGIGCCALFVVFGLFAPLTSLITGLS